VSEPTEWSGFCHSATVNEWRLQEVLTARWLRDGIVLGHERLMLVAWEVMVPSWDINDAAVRWNEPSIDFLALDQRGRLAAIELKVSVSGRKPAWAVLCQVTHRAVRIGRTFTRERLEDAHASCLSGAHGRVTGAPREIVGVGQRHAEFFDTETPLRVGGGVRRVVAATSFGPSFDQIRESFNTLPVAETLTCLSAEYATPKGQAAREFARVAAVLPIKPPELSTPVEVLVVSEDGV